MTTTSSWLALTEYSMKHHVSISTLRRRIKSEDIEFRFDDGKYFILDETPQRQNKNEAHRPSLKSETALAPTEKIDNPEMSMISAQHRESGESVFSAANKLLIDLKKAYTQVLHEKEEQIMFLKEETVDLKTLIKILESENSRLRERLP